MTEAFAYDSSMPGLPDLDAEVITGTGPGTDPEPTDPESVPGAAPGDVVQFPGTDSASLDTLPDLGDLPVPVRLELAVRHWAGNALAGFLATWNHPAGPVPGMYYGHSDSFAEHWQYAVSAAWVPGSFGRTAAIITASGGFAFHLFIGFELHLAGEFLKWMGQRTTNFAIGLAVLGILAIIITVL